MKFFNLESILLDQVLSVATVIIGGALLYHIIFFFIKRWTGTRKHIPLLLQKYVYVWGLIFIMLLVLMFSLQFFGDYLTIRQYKNTKHILTILLISSTAALIIQLISFLREMTLHHFLSEDPGDFSHRKAKTQFQIIQKVLNVLIIIGAIAIILMTFDSIRKIGDTMLASAGVAGLVLGFAAQKSLGTLFAGIQIAISQPIRIEDVVVVQGTSGVIGEITLTYVVVHTWDGRRLIIPINYFLENSFENWTRTSPEIIGKVFIHADYSLPVEKIREEFNNLVEASELWDKRVSGLLVTDSKENTIVIRCVMSTRNSSDAFDMQCMVREKLIAFIQLNYPECLPKTRISISNDSKSIE